MVLLTFAPEVLSDAGLLPSLSADALSEFCSIAMEHVKAGSISRAKYAKAAAALGVEAAALQEAVQALAHMFVECTRRNASAEDLIAALESLAFSDAHKAALTACYTASARDLRALLSDLSLRLPHYQNAEWRLDLVVGSRLCRAQLTPVLLLELEVRDARDQPATHRLQLDYANLDHLVQQLELAVKESNNKHSRRVIRYVK